MTTALMGSINVESNTDTIDTASKSVNFVRDLGYPRGWHRRKTFKIDVNGETRFYVRGVQVTEDIFTNLI